MALISLKIVTNLNPPICKWPLKLFQWTEKIENFLSSLKILSKDISLCTEILEIDLLYFLHCLYFTKSDTGNNLQWGSEIRPFENPIPTVLLICESLYVESLVYF